VRLCRDDAGGGDLIDYTVAVDEVHAGPAWALYLGFFLSVVV
jgi:hypothetical protein